MLVIDDFNELEFIETLLKRMGFDVLSLNRDAGFGDKALGFFPALVISTLKGPMVDGVKVSNVIKKQAPNTKMVVLYSKGTTPNLTNEQKSKIDALIETPVQPQDTLLIIAQLLKSDAAALLDKFDKLARARNFGRGDEAIILKDDPAKITEPTISSPQGGFGGGLGRASDQPKSEREKRYDAFLEKNSEPVDRVVPHERMVKDVQELAEASKSEQASLDALNEKKKEFVRAMMNKAKE